MWIKICGNTTLEDALHAAQSGADALGFIFARSPRQLSPEQAATLIAQVPRDVERVGIFDSHDASEIAQTARHARLTTIQLHGGFDEQLLDQLTRPNGEGFAIIQALHWDIPGPGAHSAETLLAQLQRVRHISERLADPVRVLVDSRLGSATGGTGIAYNWSAAAQVFAEARALGLPIIAAGGLRPENVADAIAHLQPWGVDVASGVELSPGRKNPARVATFIANARG